jgi:diguanylate cyclase (GGDEF)-like protein
VTGGPGQRVARSARRDWLVADAPSAGHKGFRAVNRLGLCWLKRSTSWVDQTSMDGSARLVRTAGVAATPHPEPSADQPRAAGPRATQPGRVGPGRVGLRVATVGLVLVLLALTGFVTWTSTRMNHATKEVARTSRVSDAWDRALLALSTQATLLERYRVAPDADVRARFAAETASFGDALALLARSEHEGEHQAHVAEVTGEYRRLGVAAGRLLDAVDARDPARVAALRDGEVGPLTATVSELVGEGAVEEREAAGVALRSLRRLNQLVLVATPLVFLGGLALLLGCWGVVRGYQRGIERHASDNRHQALHDTLTGLPNRLLFRDRTEQAIRAAQRDGGSAALLLMDLDRFKEVNDTLGHHYGDVLLTQIGPRLRSVLRAVDTLARLGGDEFAVLLPEVGGEDGARGVAERLLEALTAPILLDGLPLTVDASIGVVLYPAHGEDPDTLLQHADIAMYAAKETHAGYMVFDSALDQHSPRRLLMLSELRGALDHGELVLHYQPKADLQTGQVAGVEALVRWQHPRYGLLSPAEFIPLAERSGLVAPLTSYVLNQALRQCQQWQQAGHQLSVAVNVPTRCLLDLAFPEEVARLLQTWQVPAGRLVLELTEGTIMADPGRAVQVLTRLRDLGVELAIDDFGTGYSSMSYLKALPVHELKVDRSFVQQMVSDDGDAVIVRSTIELGHNLGLRVVAEGVEDAATWQELQQLGCDNVQGFFLGRPMPPADLEAWLGAPQQPPIPVPQAPD